MPSGTWSGRILEKRNINQVREYYELSLTDDHATILPYRVFDLNRPPLLLIHGVGTPRLMRSLAERFHGCGFQVWFLFYDELGNYPHTNGAQIASKLNAIREDYYSDTTSLAIVAHSIGSIVSRCLLNVLQEPNWRLDGQTNVGAPRAGFNDVRLRTIDALWAGFGSDKPEHYDVDAIGSRIILFIMKLLGVEGAYSVAAGSQTFKHLYEVALDQVDIQNLVAKRPSGRKDWVPSLPESTPKKAQEIARCLVFNELPDGLTVKNLCLGLKQDSRFPALKTAIESAIANGTLSLDVPADTAFLQELTTLHDSVMPRYTGGHIGVALDDEDDAQDLVDALVEDLRPTP